MNIRLIAWTLLCVTGIACGQLLFKRAAMATVSAPDWQSSLCNPWLWAVFVLYSVTTLLWVWILRQAPLHIVYPFMGLAFILVPLLARVFLGEPGTLQTITGGLLILACVIMATMSRPL